MGFKIIRTNNASQPADAKFINMTDWLINNTLGKDRRRFDAMAYNIALNGNTVVFHPEADVLKNVSSADFAYYYAPDDSETNMKLSYDTLQKGSYLSVRSYREFKCGTAMTVNVTGSSPQVVTVTGLSDANYYVITIPTNKVSTLTVANGTLVKNTEILVASGFPAGVTSFLFKPNSGQTSVAFTLTVTGGVGLAVASPNTEVKCFLASPWVANELAIISCSD